MAAACYPNNRSASEELISLTYDADGCAAKLVAVVVLNTKPELLVEADVDGVSSIDRGTELRTDPVQIERLRSTLRG